jgi:hypothetical protein
MAIDITPEAVERLAGPRTHICWTPDGVPEHLQELVVLVRASDLDALSAALTASQAETAAAYEVAADSLLECSVWCDNQERADDGWRNGVIDARKHHTNRIRALTPADSKAALDRMIAEAEERGMRKAADKLRLVGNDEYTNDFNRGFDRGIEWSRNTILESIPKGTPHE